MGSSVVLWSCSDLTSVHLNRCRRSVVCVAVFLSFPSSLAALVPLLSISVVLTHT